MWIKCIVNLGAISVDKTEWLAITVSTMVAKDCQTTTVTVTCYCTCIIKTVRE